MFDSKSAHPSCICYYKYSLTKYCANQGLTSIQTEVEKVLKPERILRSDCLELFFYCSDVSI